MESFEGCQCRERGCEFCRRGSACRSQDDAAGKVIGGILTAAVVGTFLVWACFGYFEVLPLFFEGE